MLRRIVKELAYTDAMPLSLILKTYQHCQCSLHIGQPCNSRLRRHRIGQVVLHLDIAVGAHPWHEWG